MTDKVKFYAAARKLLDHLRAKGRANGVRLIARMPAEDLHFVADKVVHIAENKDLAYHSCHNMDPISGVISLMARLNIKGGIEHAFDVLDSEGGKGTFKIKMLLDILPKYGANAKEALPRIKATKAASSKRNGMS